MGFWKQAGRRAAYWFRRSEFEDELEQEIRFHLETRIEELERAGLSNREAAARARREFGSGARMREESRAAWQFQWLEDLLTDLRHAARTFRKKPSFTLTALACLALGIGANTLIFSLVDAILLRSLPYPNADRIVMVRFTPPAHSDQKLGTNPGSYFFIREHSRVFERMGAVRLVYQSVSPNGGDSASQWVQTGWCSPGLTDVMGVKPVLGRWFSGYDRDFPVVISYGLWQRAFGSAPDVIGRKLNFGSLGAPQVIGVAPPGFQTLDPEIDVWVLQPDENLALARRSPNRVFNLFARLKPGVTVAQAQAEMDSLASPMGAASPIDRGWSIRLDSLRDAYIGNLRQLLLIFQGAVLILLLIACANVASLLLAQATTRHRELALRSALGSSRGRVIRQLLAENLLLSILGYLVGVVLAWSGLHVVTSALPTMLPRFIEVTLNPAVLGYSLLLSLATGLIFGALPALHMSRSDLMDVLRDASRSTLRRSNLRGALVAAEVALAVVLLIGAGLMTNSLLRLNLVRPGFETRGLVTVQVPFQEVYKRTGINTAAGGMLAQVGPKLNQVGEEIRERLTHVPGAESAALTMTPPLGGTPRRFNFSAENRPLAPSEQEAWTAEWYPVSPDYFHTLRIPLLRGREFAAADSDTSRPVAVINATLAERFFRNENPIGKQIQTGVVYDPPREIVGIVGDVRQNRYEYAPQPQMYVPRAQLPQKMDLSLAQQFAVGTYVVRTHGDPAGLLPALRTAIRGVDRTFAITNSRTVDDYAAGQLQDLRHYTVLLSIFGGISILLSVAGLFGIMMHSVNQRTNEIGIRVALGARSGSILGMVAQQGMLVIGIGILCGVVASLALTRVIGRFLWGVTATDPLTFVLVLLAMLIVGLLACLVPARRALRIDPILALRWE
ncbi:MAG TPA: ABC transporter permease [Bryobacteraceae bacterium]